MGCAKTVSESWPIDGKSVAKVWQAAHQEVWLKMWARWNSVGPWAFEGQDFQAHIMVPRGLQRYGWGILGYTFFVILWGGIVRATGSGAGCGDHWPLCNGDPIPQSPTLETLIEFGHRVSSGLYGLLIVGLVIWVFRVFPKGTPVRKSAVWVLIFTMLEAAIGAGLVIFEQVAYTVSIGRAFWMGGHLLNTFFLFAALTLTMWGLLERPAFRVRGHGVLGLCIGVLIGGTLILGVSGAVAALGDTLTLGGGISPESSPIVATLVGLRIYHPLLALVVAAALGGAVYLGLQQRTDPWLKPLAYSTIALYLAQLILGLINVWLQAPIWLQMVHLLVSDLIWIGLIAFCATVFSAPAKPHHALT